MQTRELKVVATSIGELRANPRNPRTHSKAQIRRIADSIRTFGFTNPVLVDRAGMIVAGHGRVEAAKLLGMSDVPTVRLDHLSPDQLRAYLIADNRLAELAGWDKNLLAAEFSYLAELDVEFDLSVTGFLPAEVDLMVETVGANRVEEAADEIFDVGKIERPVTRSGDLWLLGDHRLLCGDAREPAAYERLMNGRQAQMIFSDPPYNVAIEGHVSGKGRIRHREFAIASGEMSKAEYTAFLITVFRLLGTHGAAGSVHFIFIDWRHLLEALTAGHAAYSELLNLCVWAKTNGGMGSLYRSQHELVLVFKSGRAAHINNVELGRHGRNRTNLWTHAGVNTFRGGRMDDLAAHPTVKPVALVSDAILDVSKRRGIVLDPFAGSGTTIIAAEKTGRRAYCIEIDPVYVDAAIRRWQLYTSAEAIHAETGLSFAGVDAKRRRKGDTPRRGIRPKVVSPGRLGRRSAAS